MLILPIKKKWFDMIKSGEKKEEYREIKPYWRNRFFKYDLVYKDGILQVGLPEIIFKNGYRKDSPTIRCKCKLRRGTGNPEWGAEPNKEYYILDILEIKEK